MSPRDHLTSDNTVVAKLVALARERLPAAQLHSVEPFLVQYYAQVDPEDLNERELTDLYGAALSHWQFLRRRQKGQARVRIYNPTLNEHGWQSSHTVIEIVNDDMPFLVDSVSMEVNRQGLTLHLIIHPVIRVNRDAEGNLLEVSAATGSAAQLESYIHVEMDRQTDPAKLAALEEGIKHVLGDVRLAVQDWQKMQAAMQRIIDEMGDEQALARLPLDLAEAREERAFLQWILDHHYTILGYREYDLSRDSGSLKLKPVAGSGLGVLAKPTPSEFTALPPEAAHFVDGRNRLLFTKANVRATVHRPGYLDYIGIKRFNKQGIVDGELRFIGLLTSTAYNASAATIPLLRRKMDKLVERSGLLPGGHMHKSLITILETYPRDELFQINDEDLYTAALGILRLEERQRVRLFVRRDLFGRFFSCLVYVPRDKYNTELRERVQAILMEALQGNNCEFSPELSESVLARIHFTIRTEPGRYPSYDVRELERQITQASRRWQDDLLAALIERHGEERANTHYQRFAEAFPAGFREENPARSAVHDIEMMAALTPENSLAMNLYRPLEAEPGSLRFKLYQLGKPITLSESLPIMERMGVKVIEERPYRIDAGDETFWIHDFGLLAADDPDVAVEQIKPLFQETFNAAWRGAIENDDFNRLVLRAHFSAREIVIFRAYGKYCRQIGFNFSQSYIEATLVKHPQIVTLLRDLFYERFDPKLSERKVVSLLQEIDYGLDQVTNLDEDRILRQLLSLILATLRTNYFQTDADGKSKSYLSFKFNPAQVPGLPEPKPMFEIWVYSPRVEGVHLRGGKVARGGLRWSDRREDFRTEVLGLVKAQMVKNTVIVPVGSKGGFVVKQPPAEREAYLKEGVACYQTFLCGLLDLTDNLVAGKIVPPRDVVRHDADDPYLVVAADKGTATFSDIANQVSQQYGFWLGDAFASGGSNGYDHKAMGITARGAWESVKRHFREMGIDTQTTPFTVAGIGDMSGDVFGNGMLLSRQIKLIAAFDHRDIFLDPDPDPETSFRERERLFKLPRSSWQDYDKKLISSGGGIFSRGAKSIPLSPEIRQALAIQAESLPPNELMHNILKAPVDLFYNGGIGTYVKASSQSHADVGDRANDAIRVNGNELRCKVIAEGGNLGFTQLGRVEYAQIGGRLYTDAIDNSAGVDCSDHEVNIKILLNTVVNEGELTEKQRNKLLADMTDEVAQLVLQDNYYQTQSLSVNGRHAPSLIDLHARLIRALEKRNLLNRAIEFLPTDEDIVERKTIKQGLTGPERAVLLAYSKMALYDDLLASDLPDDPFFSQVLVDYFPKPLRERYREAMQQHPLRREIIATAVTNSTINRAGTTFVQRLADDSGAKAADVVRAYTIAREVFALSKSWAAIEALDTKVADAVQAEMLMLLDSLLERATQWFLHRYSGTRDINSVLGKFCPSLDTLTAKLVAGRGEQAGQRAKAAEFVKAGVPVDLAAKVALSEVLYSALDIVEISVACQHAVESVATVYFALDQRLEHDFLRRQIDKLSADSHWQYRAKRAMQDDLASQLRALATQVLQSSIKSDAADAIIKKWETAQQPKLERAKQVLADLRGAGTLDLAMLSVALRELNNLL